MKKLFFALAFAFVAIMGHARTYNYDVNKDGMVNITDVTFLVNNIMGVPNVGEDEQNYMYDVNGDGMVNVTDVTCLVNKILGILNPSEEPPSYLTCPDNHHPHFIDLGLPSGTKWACCNVGADKPEAYGGYYAWGETEVKDSYDMNTYSFYDGSSYTFPDDDIAFTQYDVAHVKWGGLWCMPSKDQMEELVDKCDAQTTTLNGVSGCVFTANNGGTIFLPHAGYYQRNRLVTNVDGCYWSSTHLNARNCSGLLLFNNHPAVRAFNCFLGYTVRPVSVPILNVSSTTICLSVGSYETVEVTTGTGFYIVTSSDEAVATAELEDNRIKVTAMDEGQTTITMTDKKTGLTATIDVTVFPSLELSTDNLFLAVGSQETVMITSGSDNYVVASSNGAVATAEMQENNVKVTATGVGEATVTVTDTRTGLTSTIEVTVVPAIMISNTTLTIGLDRQASVEITSGSGSYVVASSDEAVATAVLEDNLVKVTATGVGEATITVTDTKSGLIITIDVTVYPSLELSTDNLFLAVSSQEIVDISGSGNYTVVSNDEAVATAEKQENFVKVTATGVGEATITVTDTRTGLTSTIEVTVVPNLELSNATLVIANGLHDAVEIISGSGYYVVASNDEAVATAVLEDNLVKVTATDVGEATITVTDTKIGQTATIKVTVIPILTLSSTHLNMTVGYQETVEIVSGSGSYTVRSSKKAVATAVLEGNLVKVTSISEGWVTITVTDTITGLIATIEVTVIPKSYLTCPDDNHPHLIDLGLPSGTMWACCNVNSDQIYYYPPFNPHSPTRSDSYYAWGETYVKSIYTWETYIYDHGDYCDDLGADIAGTQYDVAHVKWGGCWVMPSEEQMRELFSECSHNTMIENGIKGYLLTSKSNGGSIFLPGAGYRSYDELEDEGICYYWSSTSRSMWSSCYIRRTEIMYDNRFPGYPVRPVVCIE